MKGTRNLEIMFSIHGSCVFTNSFRRENKITDPKNIYTNYNYDYGGFITDQKQSYKVLRVDIKLKTQSKQQV